MALLSDIHCSTHSLLLVLGQLLICACLLHFQPLPPACVVHLSAVDYSNDVIPVHAMQ